LAAKHAAESAAAEEASSKPAPQSGPSAPRVPMKAVRKDVKSLLKGVVVKKKPKPEASKGAVAKESVTKTTGKREADGEADKAEAEKRAKVDS
jgi:ribosomal protein L19E